MNSASWATYVRKLLLKYELPDALYILNNPDSKCRWKARLNKAINIFWSMKLMHAASLYSSLKYLNIDCYRVGKTHPIISSVQNAAEIPRINTRIKIATGTYILQSNRATFNQNAVNPECLLCKSADETLQHFLLECTALANTREPILKVIKKNYAGVIDKTKQYSSANNRPECCNFLSSPARCRSACSAGINARRLCFALHIERYNKLSLVPRRRRSKK